MIDLLDRVAWWTAAAAFTMACYALYDGNLHACVAWLGSFVMFVYYTLRSGEVDELRDRLMDRDVQVRHYQSELYPMPDRPDLQPRDRQGRVVPFESDADRPMPPWLKRGGAG